MKQKMIEFLELAEKASKFNPYTHENYLEHIELYSRSLAIAPLAVNKLMEAVELLERARGWLSSELGCTRQLSDEISKFLEEFK